MTDVRYRLEKGQKLTKQQIEEIERSKKLPLVFDEDSPDTDPVKNPELYAAMMKGVAERNRRIAGKSATPA